MIKSNKLKLKPVNERKLRKLLKHTNTSDIIVVSKSTFPVPYNKTSMIMSKAFVNDKGELYYLKHTNMGTISCSFNKDDEIYWIRSK